MRKFKRILVIILIVAMLLLVACQANTTDLPINTVDTSEAYEELTTTASEESATLEDEHTTEASAELIAPVETTVLAETTAQVEQSTIPVETTVPAETTAQVEQSTTPAETTVPIETTTQIEQITAPTEPETTVEEPTAPAEPETTVEEPTAPAEPETTVEEPTTLAEPETTVAETQHQHNYNTSTTKKATCTTDGIKTFTCSCGDSYTEKLFALGHDYKKTTVAETCTAKGYTKHSCKNCGDSYISNEVAATGHSYGSYVYNNDATTEADGTETRTCSSCGKTDTRTANGTKLAPAHSHSYTENVTTEATCTTEGLKTLTCECGDSYTEVIAKLGHDRKRCECTYVEPPTCTMDGYYKFECSCGYSWNEVIPAIGHKMSGWVSLGDATFKADGHEINFCENNCGLEEVRVEEGSMLIRTCPYPLYTIVEIGNVVHAYHDQCDTIELAVFYDYSDDPDPELETLVDELFDEIYDMGYELSHGTNWEDGTPYWVFYFTNW